MKVTEKVKAQVQVQLLKNLHIRRLSESRVFAIVGMLKLCVIIKGRVLLELVVTQLGRLDADIWMVLQGCADYEGDGISQQ